jgi:predicted permease
MSTLMRDIRFSIRTLSKSPGFTLVSVLTMALGIGALSSIFSVFNAVMIRALPYKEPSRLILVDAFKEKDGERFPISYLDFKEWSRRQHSFESLAARTETRSFILRTASGPELTQGEIVSSRYFHLLGIKPAKGRLFLPEEDVPPGTHRVALVSDALWHSHFGADPEILGKTLDIDGVTYQVAGVLPPGFEGLTDQAKVFLPLSMAPTLGPEYVKEEGGLRWLYTVGRLKKGVTLEQAKQDMNNISRQLEAAEPKFHREVRAKLSPLADAWFGELRRKLLILLASGFFLLLIVGTNLANLLLARFVARRRDLSLRMALGARRSGLVRQILTESMILALLGCGTGLLVARWSTGLLVRMSGIQLKSFVDVNIDLVVVAVILTVSLLSGFLFGLVPALVLSSKLRLYEIFNEVGRRGMQGESHHRFQNMLIIGEVAIALLLLVCAGLMTKGFQRLASTDLGFKSPQVLTLRMSTRVPKFKDDDPAVWNLVEEAQQKIAAVPGVTAVAFEGPGVPTDDLNGANAFGAFVTLEDRPPEDEPVLMGVHFVSPSYFSTLGVAMARGRNVLAADTTQTQRVAVVSESVARKLWPRQNALGKRVMIGRRTSKPPKPWLTVVGVVPDMKHAGLLTENRPDYNVYVPLMQQVPRQPPALGLLVRTSVPPLEVASEIQRELHALAPDLPIYDVATLEARLAQQTAGNRAFVLLMSLFALFALALAAVGVYGVVSYSVANRTQEIGVRMALGAQLRDVLRLVVGQGGRLALMGVALGLLLALVITPVLTTWLYGVSPLDKIILVGMSVLLLGVAMVASYIPARRAAKVAPFQALRLD